MQPKILWLHELKVSDPFRSIPIQECSSIHPIVWRDIPPQPFFIVGGGGFPDNQIITL